VLLAKVVPVQIATAEAVPIAEAFANFAFPVELSI
jgi:hypothetical protein